VTPICPHVLTNDVIVLINPPIELSDAQRRATVSVSVDGQGISNCTRATASCSTGENPRKSSAPLPTQTSNNGISWRQATWAGSSHMCFESEKRVSRHVLDRSAANIAGGLEAIQQVAGSLRSDTRDFGLAGIFARLTQSRTSATSTSKHGRTLRSCPPRRR